MASGRRKKSLQVSLKYEIYGILLIVFSVITLAGKDEIRGMGSVGHALNYIFYVLAGHFYFVFPLIGIYVGLYVMMKRRWPRAWTYRKTGLILIWLGFLVRSHLDLFARLQPEEPNLASTVAMPLVNLRQYLSGDINADAFLLNLGGGLAGAVLFGVLNFLFDRLGAQLVMYSLWIIGFLCVTGWSIADLADKIGGGLQKSRKAFRARMQDLRLILRGRSAKAGAKSVSPAFHVDVEEEWDEEHFRPTPESRAKSTTWKWFQLFSDNSAEAKSSSPARDQEDAPVDEEEDEDADGVLIGRKAEPQEHEWEDDEDLLDETDDMLEEEDGEEEEDIPHIRDFQDHEAAYAHVPDDALNGTPSAGSASGEERTDKIVHSPQEKRPYQLPPLHLLSRPPGGGRGADPSDHKANARKLEATLESFGVRAKVLEVVRGPAVTRYEVQPDVGVKVSRIVGLTDDIALALAAKDIRMEAPIPGKSAIGIEVPNSEVSIVTLREVMESAAFLESEAKLSIALGRDISGEPIVANLAKMPHLLVAGATGSGKSVCINGIIVSILYKARPDEVKFLMIDPKMVELNMYNGIPHLLAPVVTDPRRASLALKQVVREMEKRYELFSKSGTRNIEGYNAAVAEEGERLPYIVVIVDELADLMMVAAGDVEDAITRLAQMARAAGIHLIIATQRPSVDVITGVIKANIPSRIAFGVSSQVDSRTILDAAGAEKLLGRGDMLFVPVGSNKPIRVQGAFLSDQEVEAVVQFVRGQEQAEYQEHMVPQVEDAVEDEDDMEDELYDQAVQIVLEAKQTSVSLLQRRMRIGYTRAARLIDAMEKRGIVGPYEGSKPREVLMTIEQYTNNRASS